MKKHIYSLLATGLMAVFSAQSVGAITSFYVDGLKFETIESNGKVVSAGLVRDLNNRFNYCKLSGEVNIPASVTFEGTELPVTKIYAEVFAYNTTITKVTVPASVTDMNGTVFKDATALKEVDLSRSNIKALNGNLFEGCTELLRVDFPASATSWNTTSAFKGCAKLKSVTFPDDSKLEKVTGGTYSTSASTNTGAFYGCTALKSFQFPASVLTVSASSMFANSGVTEVVFADNRDVVDMTQKYPGLVVSGTYLFADCPSLQTVIFPTVINYLGTAYSTNPQNHYVFYRCPELTNIVFPDGATINTIGHYFMVNCGIRSIKLPESITTIGNNAFRECASLESFDFPPLVKTVPDYCFYKCTALENVVLHENLETISGYAFNGCSSLKSIIVPEGVKTLSSYALYGCSSLEYAVLPSTLTSCGYLFNNDCTSVKAIIARASVPSTLSTSTNNNNWWSNVTVYVPSETAKEAYQKKNGWKKLPNYAVAGELAMPSEATIYLNEVTPLSDVTRVNHVDTSVPELAIAWNSSNSDVASVDVNGLITAKALTNGTPVTITGSYWGVEMKCDVTILENPFLITPKDVAMGLDATVAPVISLAYNQYGTGMGELPANPVYELVSDDTEVVEITENGFLHGLKYGEAKIKATYRGETKEFTAYVQPEGNFGIDAVGDVKVGESVALQPWIEVGGVKTPVDPSTVKWSTSGEEGKSLFIDSKGIAYGVNTETDIIVSGDYYGKVRRTFVSVIENDNPAIPQARNHNLTVHMPDALGRVTVLNAPSSALVEFEADDEHELSTAKHNGNDISGSLNNNRYTVTKNADEPSVITAGFDEK